MGRELGKSRWITSGQKDQTETPRQGDREGGRGADTKRDLQASDCPGRGAEGWAVAAGAASWGTATHSLRPSASFCPRALSSPACPAEATAACMVLAQLWRVSCWGHVFTVWRPSSGLPWFRFPCRGQNRSLTPSGTRPFAGLLVLAFIQGEVGKDKVLIRFWGELHFRSVPSFTAESVRSGALISQ